MGLKRFLKKSGRFIKKVYTRPFQLRKNIKKVKGFIKKNPELAAASAAFIPGVGSVISGGILAKYGAPPDMPSDFSYGDSSSGFVADNPMEEAPPTTAAGIDPKILMYGGAAILLLLIMRKRNG